MKKSGVFLFLFFILLIITIITRFEPLFLLTIAVYLLHVVTLNAEVKRNKHEVSERSVHPSHVTKGTLKKNTPEANLAKGIIIAVMIPFIFIAIIFISIAAETGEPIFAFLAMGFGLFFVIMLMITIIITRNQSAKFDSITEQNEEPALAKTEEFTELSEGHEEHDAFINEYSKNEKDCYEEKECFEDEVKKEKKKKSFNPFHEHEWDDEDEPIDC